MKDYIASHDKKKKKRQLELRAHQILFYNWLKAFKSSVKYIHIYIHVQKKGKTIEFIVT